MRIPKHHASEFRFWFAWGQVCGYRFGRAPRQPGYADVATLFGRFKPLVNETWCWWAFLNGWKYGMRPATEEEV